ncbi:MAG TPA: WD40 repeat domain-containing protein, partial [Gemmataceae bacterium]|nr:WD40 repeat domain-containing protein [Gemmataceae bacterium]
MRRCIWLTAFLLASPILGQGPARLDDFGDPLPPGALRRYGTIRFRQDCVDEIAFLPDGKSFVAQGEGGVVHWDVATGKPLPTIATDFCAVRRPLSLSAGGRLLVGGDRKGEIVVIDLSDGKERFRQVPGGQDPCAVLSPDGSLLAIGSDKGLNLWDLKTGKERPSTSREGISDPRFSPDGKQLLVAGWGDRGRLRVVDPSTGNELPGDFVTEWKNNDDCLQAMEITPDQRLLVISKAGSGIEVFDFTTRKSVRRLEGKRFFLAISPDSKTLAVTKGTREIELHELDTGKVRRRWRTDKAMLTWSHGAFSPDGKMLAIPFEAGIQLWDPATGKRIDPYRAPIDVPVHLSVSDDGKSIAVIYGSHTDEHLLLLDAATLRQKGRLDIDPLSIAHTAFSPDGRKLAVGEQRILGDKSRRVRLMDTASGKDCTPASGISGFLSHWRGDHIVVDREGKNKQPEWVTVNPVDGKQKESLGTPSPKLYPARPLLRGTPIDPHRTVVTIDDFDAVPDKPRNYLAEWPSGKMIRPVELTTKEGVDLDVVGLSPDERLLVLRGRGELLLFWEIATEKVRFELKHVSNANAEYSPDGRLILIDPGITNTVADSLTYETVWDLGTVSRAAFSANGKLLVTAQLSSLLVWDARTALPRKISTEKLTPLRLRELWEDLRSDDAKAAHRAMVVFARRPQEAIAFLRTRLPDAAAVSTYKRLVAELGDADFKTRDAAQV